MTPGADRPGDDNEDRRVPGLADALAEARADRGASTARTSTVVGTVLRDLLRHFRTASDDDRSAGLAAVHALPAESVAEWFRSVLDTAEPSELPAVAEFAFAVPGLDLGAELTDAALSHADSPERAAVFASLAGSDDVRRHLLSLQRSDRLDKRLEGIAAVAALGDGREEAISRGLGDTAASVRLAAAELAVHGDDDFEADLARLAVSDPSGEVRLLATKSIVSADHARRLQVARPALVDSDVAVRCAAVGLLADRGVDEVMLLADALGDESDEVVRTASMQLADSSPTDAPGILWRALIAHDRGHRAGLLAALDRLDPNALTSTLHRAARSDDPSERALGLEVAARRGRSDELIEMLHEALTDPSVEVRMLALEALGRNIDSLDVGRVGERVHDPAPAVRREAVRLMRASTDDKTFEPLLTAASDPIDHVRAQAREALLDRRGPTLTADLLAALSDPVRRRTARDLIVALGPSALEQILEALDRAPEDTRIELGAVLRSADLIGELERRLADRNPDVRLRALIGLEAAADPISVGSVAACLADPVRAVRRLAVRTLGILGDPGAVAPLREALVSDPDLDLVPGIEEALRGLGADVPNDVVIELRSQQPVEP